MYIISLLAIIVNILSVIMLLIALFYNFEQPKRKAVFGYLMAGAMILYIVTLSTVSLYGFYKKHYLYGIILFLCIISHFIIGKIVKYETLRKYTIAQTMFYIVSLITMLLNI